MPVHIISKLSRFTDSPHLVILMILYIFQTPLAIDPIKGDFSLDFSAVDFLEFHGLPLRAEISWKVLPTCEIYTISHILSSNSSNGPIDCFLTFPFSIRDSPISSIHPNYESAHSRLFPAVYSIVLFTRGICFCMSPLRLSFYQIFPRMQVGIMHKIIIAELCILYNLGGGVKKPME